MAEIKAEEKPCFVETTQGFSVSYRGRLLYSKYNPAKAILSKIQELNILPGTIFLCCSPVLPYGLKELEQKLPENCLLLLAEENPDLYAFIKNQKDYPSLPLLTKKELYDLPVILNKRNQHLECGYELPQPGTFRRLLRIDFSAGTAFNPDFYTSLENQSVNAIMTFWSNRVTLVKFGRRFSADFFENLSRLPQAKNINNYIRSIEKPVIVCGAGESLEELPPFIKDNQKDFFILCADTALIPLQKMGIQPDGVFIEEAQRIILNAFLGQKNPVQEKKPLTVFSSLSATPKLYHSLKNADFCYFTTLYSEADFLEALQKENLLPPENMPFGSVGITAVYYALKFRKSDAIPVYIYGLDFSYSAGITHAKNTMAHKSQLSSTTRIKPVQNYAASFSQGRFAVQSKNGKRFYTTPSMQNYARVLNSLFEGTKNLYDAASTGIPLSIPQRKPSLNDINKSKENTENSQNQARDREEKLRLTSWYKKELSTLVELKALLSGEKELSDQERFSAIKKIAEPREYLYLHFPDGWQFSMELSFLKRLRAELDFFIKLFKKALTTLEK